MVGKAGQLLGPADHAPALHATATAQDKWLGMLMDDLGTPVRDADDLDGVAAAVDALVECGALGGLQFGGAEEVGDLARHVEGDRQLRGRGARSDGGVVLRS